MSDADLQCRHTSHVTGHRIFFWTGCLTSDMFIRTWLAHFAIYLRGPGVCLRARSNWNSSHGRSLASAQSSSRENPRRRPKNAGAFESGQGSACPPMHSRGFPAALVAASLSDAPFPPRSLLLALSDATLFDLDAETAPLQPDQQPTLEWLRKVVSQTSLAIRSMSAIGAVCRSNPAPSVATPFPSSIIIAVIVLPHRRRFHRPGSLMRNS